MCRGKPMQWAADGRVVRVVGTHVDITDRRRMEIQLQQSQKMEAIGTLAGGVAHDFNNILGIIIGNAELAMHDMLGRHPAATHLEEIKKAAMRAKDVVRKLLSFGRRTEQKKEPLKLQKIVGESLQFLRASIPSTIDIRSHAPSDLNVVAADPTQLHQVLINLCTNAAHAMESNGGVLEVRLATAPDQFDLVITDMTMPGMTGAQLSAAILQIRPDIPIILCSGFNEKIDSRSALDFGFRRCIEKPFNQQELATAVRKTLDGL
jgi:signal transduction histidine kinase